MPPLLRTKFYPPAPPAGCVLRPLLLEQLDQATRCKLTVLSAPAGFGKTTLAISWIQAVKNREQAAFGWLTLESGDNDGPRFIEYLAACCQDVCLLPTAVAAPSISHRIDYPLAGALDHLIQAWMHLRHETVIILDDYQVIQNPEVHAALQYLLDHLPPRLHLMLLTRSDPPLQIARLRLAGQLVELRMEQLRFSTQEASAFLIDTMGVQIAPEDVAVLNQRAEGWIAGLQMAAISLRGRDDSAAFVAAFAGSHRYVFDYLLEQVLDRQPPDVRAFLLKTSLLERLSAPLCDAVAGPDGTARQLLDTVERSNLFLVPLDEERLWYRYHPLFADLLKLVLEQAHPGLSPELHRRACRWYQSQDMLPEALRHALASGDMQDAARMLSANVLALVDNAELIPVLLQMDAAPQEQRQALPWLSVAHAWALAYTGQLDRASAALLMAERGLPALPVDEQRRLAGHLAAVRAYRAWIDGSQPDALAFAEQAAENLPLDEIAVRSLNLTTLGNAMMQSGLDPRSLAVLEQATALAWQAGQSHVLMPAATALAYACIAQGRIRRAFEICQESIQVADEYQRRNARPLSAAASVYAVLARVWQEWGDADEAVQIARKGLALSELWGQADTVMLCLLYLAHAQAFAGDLDAAYSLLSRARKIAQKTSPWFVMNVEYVELDILLDDDTLDVAWLSQEMYRKQAAGLPISPLMQARLLLRQDKPGEALPLLEQALFAAHASPSIENVSLYAVQALAYASQKEETRALVSLQRALDLAEPEKRVADFLRGGAAMKNLLQLALSQSIAPSYVRKLLAAFAARRQPAAGRRPAATLAAQALVDPLSEREMEVLQHLSSHLSTPEIAQQLVVSANTVRTHIKSIYAKLGVHRRTAAVLRARELGMLE